MRDLYQPALMRLSGPRLGRSEETRLASTTCGGAAASSSASSLEAAVYALEELEETAKLVLLTRNLPVRRLDRDQIEDLNASFGLK
jgi:hypothetical protein